MPYSSPSRWMQDIILSMKKEQTEIHVTISGAWTAWIYSVCVITRTRLEIALCSKASEVLFLHSWIIKSSSTKIKGNMGIWELAERNIWITNIFVENWLKLFSLLRKCCQEINPKLCLSVPLTNPTLPLSFNLHLFWFLPFYTERQNHV